MAFISRPRLSPTANASSEVIIAPVGKLADEGRFDHLVIESTGVSEPMPVAETFTFTQEDGTSLDDRDQAVGEGDERTIVDLLNDQIEFSNVILLNKTDLITEAERTHIHGAIRSKGVFWLATRLKYAGFWSQAGAVSRHQCAGFFWAAVPEKHWPEDRAHIDRVWKGNNGDCRQEIVLIGRNMDRDALTAMLDACLLSEAELHTDEQKWHKLFPDPFLKWKMGVMAF